jgi:trans-L-3-hydroxyproline dehydratase
VNGLAGSDWTPPGNWRRLTTIDAHTAGEPLRVVTGGFPELPGDTILAKRRYAREHYDNLRKTLILEPRGHADMYGCVLTPPVTPDGDVGVLFLHNEGFSTMCGHGIIGLVKVGLDCGLIDADKRGRIRIDTPAGRVSAAASIENGRVTGVSFLNVPSFVMALDQVIDVEALGEVRFDVAFGGAFYAYVDAPSLGLELGRGNTSEIIDAGMRIKRAVADRQLICHPAGEADLDFLYGTIFVERIETGDVHSRNVCVFAEGEIDRSPTGTGVSGRAAIHHARGELPADKWITIESLIGTQFQVRVYETTEVAGVPAVVPEVHGTAHITGRNEFLIDPDDPLAEGFLLR